MGFDSNKRILNEADRRRYHGNQQNRPIRSGSFKETYGIDTKVKEHVIYMRYETGRMNGGGYRGNSNLHYVKGDGRGNFTVLDMVLKKLKPEISYLEYKDIENLIRSNNDRDNEDYYGNSTDYVVEYILMSELENILFKDQDKK